MLIRCHLQELAAALASAGMPEAGLVFVASDQPGGWAGVGEELAEAFHLTKEAAALPAPVVYVVSNDDLLGRRGPEQAMVACGLLSAARTAALELAKARVPVNTLAIESGTDPTVLAGWTRALLEPDAPTGELVRLGAGHLGKALP